MFFILKGDYNFILSPSFSNDRNGYILNIKSFCSLWVSSTLKAPSPPSEHRTEPDKNYLESTCLNTTSSPNLITSPIL